MIRAPEKDKSRKKDRIYVICVTLGGVVVGALILGGVAVEIYSLTSPEAYLTVRRWEFIAGWAIGGVAAAGVGIAIVYILIADQIAKLKKRLLSSSDKMSKT